MKRTHQISRDFFWKTYGLSSFGAKGGYAPREYAMAIGYTKPITDVENMQGRRDNWLNDAFVQKVKPGIYFTWTQIASDIEASAAMPGSGFKVTNDMAIECCLDADSLVFHCGCGRGFKEHDKNCSGKIADAEIARVLAEYDYDKVLHYLASKITLR